METRYYLAADSGNQKIWRNPSIYPGHSIKVLARQLKELEADGIIVRKAFPEIPPRVEYALSEKGKTLIGIMESLAMWSKANLQNK